MYKECVFALVLCVWRADHTGHIWHHPSASLAVIMWKVVDQHVFMNIIPNNFTFGTRTEIFVWSGHECLRQCMFLLVGMNLGSQPRRGMLSLLCIIWLLIKHLVIRKMTCGFVSIFCGGSSHNQFECGEYAEVFRGTLSVPHNIVMDLRPLPDGRQLPWTGGPDWPSSLAAYHTSEIMTGGVMTCPRI